MPQYRSVRLQVERIAASLTPGYLDSARSADGIPESSTTARSRRPGRRGVIQSEGDDRHGDSRDAPSGAPATARREPGRTNCLNPSMKYSGERIVPTMIEAAYKSYRESPMAVAPLLEWLRLPRELWCLRAGRRLGTFLLVASVAAGPLAGCVAPEPATQDIAVAVDSGYAIDRRLRKPADRGHTLPVAGRRAGQRSRRSLLLARELHGCRPRNP